MNKFKCFNCGYTWLIPQGNGAGTTMTCPRCETQMVETIRESWVREMGFGGSLTCSPVMYRPAGFDFDHPRPQKWMMD
jgi:uncharacterized paraquat-inducible protein A